MDTNDNEKSQKRMAFYSNVLNAWIQTKMEVDKTLILISSAGIGFLITLLANKKYIYPTDFITFPTAFTSFSVVIFSCFLIFCRNSSYLKTLLKNPDAKYDVWLCILDYLAKSFFIIALICTLIIGVSIGFNQLYQSKNNKGGTIMSDNKSKKTSINESLNGLNNLDSEKIDKKSLTGFGDFNPDKQTNNDSDNTSNNQNSNNEEDK